MRAIIDAKYKRLADARFPNADAYQMLAYCTAFALPQGYLIYARDAQQRSRLHHLRDGQTSIVVRAVDVERQPDDVLAQVERLAEELAFGASTATVAR